MNPIDKDSLDWLITTESILASKAQLSYAQFKHWQEIMLADRKRHDACEFVLEQAKAEVSELGVDLLPKDWVDHHHIPELSKDDA